MYIVYICKFTKKYHSQTIPSLKQRFLSQTGNIFRTFADKKTCNYEHSAQTTISSSCPKALNIYIYRERERDIDIYIDIYIYIYRYR